MSIHDWTRVDAGIFHHFHQAWMIELAGTLNRGLLPGDYYALAEQFAGGFGPDVLTLQGSEEEDGAGDATSGAAPPSGETGTLLAPPKLQLTAETNMAFYRNRQTILAIRHVSGDRVVALLEMVSPGNKAARNPLQAFVQKTAELLEKGIHLLLIDLFPPGRRDPAGIHGESWQEIAGKEYTLQTDRPLTLVAYDVGNSVRAYVVPAAVGEALTDMPLFLEPRQAITVPLETTYNATFAELPRRWRRVLEGSPA